MHMSVVFLLDQESSAINQHVFGLKEPRAGKPLHTIINLDDFEQMGLEVVNIHCLIES